MRRSPTVIGSGTASATPSPRPASSNGSPNRGRSLTTGQTTLIVAAILIPTMVFGYVWWGIGSPFGYRASRAKPKKTEPDYRAAWRGTRVSRIGFRFAALDLHPVWHPLTHGSKTRSPIIGPFADQNPPSFQWVEVPRAPQYQLFRSLSTGGGVGETTGGAAGTTGESADRLYERQTQKPEEVRLIKQRQAFIEYLQRKAAHTLAIHGALAPGPPDAALRSRSSTFANEPGETDLTFTVRTAEHDGLVDMEIGTMVERLPAPDTKREKQGKEGEDVDYAGLPQRKRLLQNELPIMTVRTADAPKAVEYLMDEALVRLTYEIETANGKKITEYPSYGARLPGRAPDEQAIN